MTPKETREAREAAYRLGGNRAAAALFVFWEVADCPNPDCDPTVIRYRAEVSVYREAGRTLPAKSPGKLEVIRCSCCNDKGRVYAYAEGSFLTGELVLGPADKEDEERWRRLDGRS